MAKRPGKQIAEATAEPLTKGGEAAEKIVKGNAEALNMSGNGVVTLPAANARCQRLKNCQAAATRVRHVSIAAVRSVRCVWAEVRWRWTLKVL